MSEVVSLAAEREKRRPAPAKPDMSQDSIMAVRNHVLRTFGLGFVLEDEPEIHYSDPGDEVGC